MLVVVLFGFSRFISVIFLTFAAIPLSLVPVGVVILADADCSMVWSKSISPSILVVVSVCVVDEGKALTDSY